MRGLRPRKDQKDEKDQKDSKDSNDAGVPWSSMSLTSFRSFRSLFFFLPRRPFAVYFAFTSPNAFFLAASNSSPGFHAGSFVSCAIARPA